MEKSTVPSGLGTDSVAVSDQRAPLLCATALMVIMMSSVTAGAQSPPETVEYYGTDAIGSIRVVFDAQGTVLGRSDYLPFGDALQPSGTLPRQGFTGQERDGETGLDYFNARQLHGRTGRFARPDTSFRGSLTNPQLWNRYSYVANNPESYIDPTGRNLWSIVGRAIDWLRRNSVTGEGAATVSWDDEAAASSYPLYGDNGDNGDGPHGGPGDDSVATGDPGETDNSDPDGDVSSGDDPPQKTLSSDARGNAIVQQALADLANKLKKPLCSGFFESPASNYSLGASDPFGPTTLLRLEALDPMVGAATTHPHNASVQHYVFINNDPQGAFFSASPNQVANLGAANQRDIRWRILGHELAHVVHNFGPDGPDTAHPWLSAAYTGLIGAVCR